MELKDRIEKMSSSLFDELIGIRRHLHENPELSFQEFETAKYLESILDSWNIKHYRVADTGVIAIIEGKEDNGKSLVLRGDIDALPIQELTGLEFASKNDGVMHACGHDIHATCVLGAAKMLNQLKNELKGTVKVLFQPGEELLPGGATKVIASGELDRPIPDAIIGQHVLPELKSGQVGFRLGRYMASSDEIYISILGSGGHAALTDQTENIIYFAAKAIQRIQERIEKNAPENMPTVIRFGKIEGLGATNVIPNEVKIEGTLRTMDEDWRKLAHHMMREELEQIFHESKARFELKIKHGYPVLFNHEEITGQVQNFAKEYLGESKVVDLDIRMTVEDFAYYSQKYNTCFYRLGIGFEDSETTKLHSPTFLANESSIKTGTGLMTYTALRYLA